MPSPSELFNWTGGLTALLVALAKVASLWGKAKKEAVDAHEQRFDKAWTRQDEMLDDCRAENIALRADNTRLRAEVADCWDRIEINRRGRPRATPPESRPNT